MRKNGFSIHAALNGDMAEEKEEEKQEEDIPADPRLPQNDFTENQLLNLWNKYLEMLKNLQKQKIYGSLNNKTLRLRENFIIEIELENEIQEAFFQEEKRDLLKFLRDKLNNYSLQLKVKIVHVAKNREPYSSEEKFQYLVEKNPSLLLLRKKLDLDLE